MAERKVLLTINRITDCDTGMYRMGELDYYVQDDVREYIRNYGEFAYREVQDLATRLLYIAQETIQQERSKVGIGTQEVKNAD